MAMLDSLPAIFLLPKEYKFLIGKRDKQQVTPDRVGGKDRIWKSIYQCIKQYLNRMHGFFPGAIENMVTATGPRGSYYHILLQF